MQIAPDVAPDEYQTYLASLTGERNMLDLGLGPLPVGEQTLIALGLVIGIAALAFALWAARRLLHAAIASRCPHCGSKFHAVPVCGDRRYERWHCRACEQDWEERYDDWDPRMRNSA